MQDVFTEFAILLFVSAFIGLIAVKLKQPLIVGFIAVGVILGPSALSLVTANDQIDLLAKLGISLLLFIVGLKLDPHIIRTMGPVALATGIGQVLFTSLFGYIIALVIGFSHIESIYIAVALTFSSTIIIVKLLSDKREVDSLHGRIAVGFLIVQDILVIVAMIALSALNETTGTGGLGAQTIHIVLYGLLFVLVIAFLMRHVLTPLLKMMAHSNELLVLFSIAWAVSLGALGSYLGFSKEVGAFVAGVSLASTPYRDVIGSRLTSLRDFLLLFFFVDLGASLNIAIIGDQISSALIFSLFVIIGNPIIVMLIMGLMGYRKRTGFLAGLTVAQISEFSLILAALGVSLGHVNEGVLGLITLVGLITISASTYMILYSHPLYNLLAPFLSIFERKEANKEIQNETIELTEAYDCVVFGLGRFGQTISETLKDKGFKILGVDFNPELIKNYKNKGIHAKYGDAEDAEFISSLNLSSIKWVISATHDSHINKTLRL
jgi:Kef-type K+ transport system membrane component KefB